MIQVVTQTQTWCAARTRSQLELILAMEGDPTCTDVEYGGNPAASAAVAQMSKASARRLLVSEAVPESHPPSTSFGGTGELISTRSLSVSTVEENFAHASITADASNTAQPPLPCDAECRRQTAQALKELGGCRFLRRLCDDVNTGGYRDYAPLRRLFAISDSVRDATILCAVLNFFAFFSLFCLIYSITADRQACGFCPRWCVRCWCCCGTEENYTEKGPLSSSCTYMPVQARDGGV